MTLTERKFRDKTDVHVSTSVGSLHRDKACVSAHQPDQTDPVVHSSALHVGRTDGPNALRHRSLEPERLIDNRNVIVYGLRYSNDAYLELPGLYYLLKKGYASMSAISTDDVQLVDFPFDQRVDYLVSSEASPGTAENSSSLVLQLSDKLFFQLDPVLVSRIESHISELDSPNILAAVESQSSIDLPDDHVQTRTQTSTVDYGCLHLSLIHI